jgi:flagellin
MAADDLEKRTTVMSNSINTNVGAMVALQNLNATNTQLQTTQSRINTGLKISSAKDDAAVWAIAQNQRSTSSSLDSVTQSLQRSSSTVDVAMAAGESISDLLTQMQAKALAAADTTLDTDSRTAMDTQFKALRDQITKTVDNATFNGINMLKSGGTTISALASSDGTAHITVAAQDLSLGGTVLTGSIGTGASISTQATASHMVSVITDAITRVSQALGNLGTGSSALSTHMTFIGKLKDSIDQGVGNLVDADLAKESANLQALQTKQQLGVQALSIANQSSSVLLSLFR